jgi:hypothetical protein
MRETIAAMLSGALIVSSSPAWAAGTEHSPLTRAVVIEARRAVAAGLLSPRPAAPRQRSWISRHPALFGALIGLAGGTVVGGAAAASCDRRRSFCLQGPTVAAGAVLGTGIGAGAGFAIGAIRR